MEFVNADVIARGLSGFAPDRAALAAGRIMLRRLRELAQRRASFAFETTLASRTFVRMLRQLARSGYDIHVIFLWLPTPDLAVTRVATRVRMGGHGVSEAVVRRRYHRGLHNFLTSYRSLATTWRVYDNASEDGPRLVAAGSGARTMRVADRTTWRHIEGGSDAKT
jgi:predicted ABC-type ATPase